MKMKYVLFAFYALLTGTAAFGQQEPRVQVATDKDIYMPGDSMHWQCALNGLGPRYNTVTLQLWIENLRNGSRWQYRFPVINGYTEGAMLVGRDIPPGRYAFNFLLQPDFFNLAGTMSQPSPKDSSLSYLVLFKDQETMVKEVPVAGDGRFAIRGLVFQDTAMFTFSKKGRGRDAPSIALATSLDSAFTPAVPVITKFINIAGNEGVKDTGIGADIRQSRDYRFDPGTFKQGRQLAEVLVKDRRPDRLLKAYEQEYVTGQFRAADDITLDGLSSDDMLKAGDIYLYLSMHVPGLTTATNPETGSTEVKWRGTSPAIYVDEYRLPDDMPVAVLPGEVAMIKVFRPGSGPLTGATSNNGAIAIYTKIGAYSRYLPAVNQHNRFFVRGYDGMSLEWTGQ